MAIVEWIKQVVTLNVNQSKIIAIYLPQNYAFLSQEFSILFMFMTEMFNVDLYNVRMVIQTQQLRAWINCILEQ